MLGSARVALAWAPGGCSLRCALLTRAHVRLLRLLLPRCSDGRSALEATMQKWCERQIEVRAGRD